jgi:hypothetical protein
MRPLGAAGLSPLAIETDHDRYLLPVANAGAETFGRRHAGRSRDVEIIDANMTR